MAIIGMKLTLLLGLVVAAALMMAAAQPAVTIYNPAVLVVDISNDDKNVKVTTEMEMVIVDLTHVQEDLQFSVADGNLVDVNMQDGDEIALFPDPTDPRNNMQALKVQVSGTELLTSPNSSSSSEVEGTPNPPQVEENPSSPEIMFNPAKLP